ncbi:TadE/TadG family type IV pilus assembly protein [Bosea sp. (in: a-proteobacteria)]|uniref:TadE/TadG family type IV pilus assembly protein n=1 Tax=Bosea sp. (in: a-proteobacteria) TaxID=1871050 RepID=UPI002B48635C|nr:pilus assembly protein TadG-related protein [Bosea sp. (in: a-proteobacteria)]WRH59999.1 MAG: pilus assembly protein TadG-related protein [Bosea sp. (in: a-proteobacteria)]
MSDDPVWSRVETTKSACQISAFADDTRGAVAIMAACAFPALLLSVGAAIDYGMATRDRAIMQAAVDAAAIAAARDLTNGHLTDKRLTEVVNGFAARQLETHGLDAGNNIAARIINSNRSVDMNLKRPMRSAFSGLWSSKAPEMTVTAIATVVGNQKICVVALDTASIETISMKSNSWLTAQDCNVYSNSKSSSGVKTDSGIRVAAKMVCSGGGYSGAGEFLARKLTDCPPVSDPLALRPEPPEGACKAKGLNVIDKGSPNARHVLQPGTYCGGLFIGGNSFVRFEPGTYIVKDGPFVVDSNADVRGEYVGFYLKGEKTTSQFLSNARVVLNAPKDGPLTGLLFFEDRATSLDREHVIKSNFVSNLTGTMYLPRGKLVVDATNEVAQQSAFTLIVVRKLYLSASPKLVVKSDYRGTDVPVPSGLGPLGGDPVLAR